MCAPGTSMWKSLQDRFKDTVSYVALGGKANAAFLTGKQILFVVRCTGTSSK